MMGGLWEKFLSVLLANIFLLSACHGDSPFSDTGILPETSAESHEAYAAVLLEDAAFFDAAAQAYGPLSDYIPLPFENDFFNTGYFCATDIDGDGEDEVFLQYDFVDSYLVFDCENGTVYGYCFQPPDLEFLSYHLKIYENTGPCIEMRHEEPSYYKIRFSHGTYALIQIPEPDLESGQFAAWYPFTKENVLQTFLPEKLDAYLAEQEALAAEWASDHKEEGEAWEAFCRVLNGDFTLIADVETRYLLSTAYWESRTADGTCTWQYALLEDKHKRQSLFIQYDTSFSALLYYDAGELICAALDNIDLHDFYTPLRDGRLLYTYHYYPGIDEFMIEMDTDFNHVTETEYFTVYIDYDIYQSREEPYSRYNDFANRYDAITGMGEYYFVTKYDNQTALKKTAISAEERWEIERQIDGLLVPDYAWKTCPEKTDPVLLNLEKLFLEYDKDTRHRDLDFLYADFEKEGAAGAFAFIGSISHDLDKPYSYPFMWFIGSVWYVDAQGCTLLAEEIDADSYEPLVILQADERHLLYTASGYIDEIYYPDISYIWTVREGKPILLLETPGFCTVENDRLLCVPSAEAALEADEAGAYNETDTATKIRCFSYDAATGTYKEEP